MNKLRLIRIYELRGLVHPIEQSVIDILDDIEEITYDDYIDYCKNGIFYFIDYCKNGIFYFSYHLNSNNIYLSSYLDNYILLKCSSEETKEIMKYILEKHLKLKINNVK